MKKFHTLQQKIIFYVMSTAILLAVLITVILSAGSIRSANTILLDLMQITARIASQNASSNLHILAERMYELSSEEIFSSSSADSLQKQERLDKVKLEVEFVWLSAYDTSGKKLYGDESAPASIADTEYYTYLTQTKNTVISDPYYEQDILQLCVGIPLKQENEVVGYLIGSYKYDILNDVLSMLILGDTGNALLLNKNGDIIGDSKLEATGQKQNIYSLYPSSKNNDIYDRALAFQTGSALMKLKNTNYYVGYSPILGTNWALFVKAPQGEFMGAVNIAILLSILLMMSLLLIAAAFIIRVAKKIAFSLSLATGRLQALAEGNLTEKVVVSNDIAETEILTNALSKTVGSLNSYIQNIQSCLGTLSSGDYTIEIPDCFDGDFSSIRISLCHITDSLNQTMRQMNSSSKDIHKNSVEVSEYARQLSDISLKQSNLIDQLEKSAGDISASIEKNKKNVCSIEQYSKDAEKKTDMGSGYMQTMLDMMGQIHNSMEEISKISQLIEGISNQTNLLSLNASIEAARAGEAGRGFSVVAAQIGQLSNQTASALSQTGEIITHAAKIIQDGLNTAEQTAKAFQEIQEVTKQYYQISNVLSETVSEQTVAVDYVNGQLSSLKEIADTNRLLAEEADKTAESSLVQSKQLQDYVSQVKVKEEK